MYKAAPWFYCHLPKGYILYEIYGMLFHAKYTNIKICARFTEGIPDTEQMLN